MLEARQVADVGFAVGVAEDQVRGFNRGGCEVRRRSQDGGDALGVIGLQVAGDLAQDVQRQLAIDGSAAVARTTVILVGAALEFAETNHFTNQSNALTDLLLHFHRHVIFVKIDGAVRNCVQDAVLLEGNGNVLRHDGVSGRGHAFSRQVGRHHSSGAIHASGSGEELVLRVEVGSSATVFLQGESGTGKELVAKAIHYSSVRSKQPFVAVNVAAIPKELIESELFGHEKGAFTGAAFRRIGKFEEANGGTLFLDEMAEMDISLQAKLLRALQEKEIIRIGSNTPVKFDCRIIIATNKDLQEEIKKGNFRQDLYYRLYGLPIELPPLRERENDVIILAKHFIQVFCKENKMAVKILTPEATTRLLAYSFPGNIRELKSVIELAVTLADQNEITADHIVLGRGQDLLDDIFSKELSLREYDIRIVRKFLEKYDNNIKLVAEKLDLGVATIYRMLKEDNKE